MNNDNEMGLTEEYLSLAHALQSGVAMDISGVGEDNSAASPKHLRVGVNMALVEIAALWQLMMDKGILTEEELRRSSINQLRIEVERYERLLSERTGAKIKLA